MFSFSNLKVFKSKVFAIKFCTFYIYIYIYIYIYAFANIGVYICVIICGCIYAQ